jgi:LysR family nitrogen assimilation transcriptional regulator
MDVKQLRYFVQVMELGSLSKAAEALHLTPPALGLHIRSLENELETQLFVRHSRGVEATSAGRQLLEHAQRILRDIEQTRSLLQDKDGPVRGKVVVGIAPALDAAQAARLIQLGAEAYPEIGIRVVSALSTKLVEWTQSGEVDLAVAHWTEELPADLESERIAQEDILFVAAADGKAHPPDITLAEVAAHPLILPARPQSLRTQIESEAEARNLALNIRFEIETIEISLKLAERGVAGCILSRGAIVAYDRSAHFRIQRIVEPNLTREMSLLRSRRKPLSRAASLVMPLINRAFGDEPAAAG